MKTLHPVDEETADRLGKAYVICSQFPDVFDDVPLKKFCGMFCDVLDDDEDEQTARMKTYAPEMYELLKAACNELCNSAPFGKTAKSISRLLERIDYGEDNDG